MTYVFAIDCKAELMFTGIILATGQISDIEQRQGDFRLTVTVGKLPIDQIQLGDSIAVNGVCLTAVVIGDNYFCADVSRETLARTTLQTAKRGAAVNLELALTPSTRMGGHFVSGHVDGIGTIVDKHADARSYRFAIEAPAALQKYIAEKGSICIDGISLTVNQVEAKIFAVNIVPHTMNETTLGKLSVGDQVNLEVDLLARYLESLMRIQKQQSESAVTETLLQNAGFLKG